MLRRALLGIVVVMGLSGLNSGVALAHGPYGGVYAGSGYGYGGYRQPIYQAPSRYYINAPVYGYGAPVCTHSYYGSPAYGYGGYSGYRYGGLPYSGYPYSGGVGYGRPGFSFYLSR